MPFQTKQNVIVSYKVEPMFNSIAAPGAGATRFRLNGGGLSLKKATVQPGEIRPDLKTSMFRHGSRSVPGGYSGDVSVGTFDPLIEAILRGTWTVATNITDAQMTSITFGANTIVAAAGSWLTQGVKVGQVIKLPNATGAPAANLNRNLRVVGVTAAIITTAETLVVDAVARSPFTLTIAKRLTQPVVPVRRSFTFDQYDQDIDQSEVFSGCRISSMKLAGGPDAMATIDFGIVGADEAVQTNVNSPYFTGPVLSNSIGLTMVDAVLRHGGADVASLTGFDVTVDNRQAGQPIVGGVITPDVSDNAAHVAGTITGLRGDLTDITRFLAETELEFHALLVEPIAEPKAFISVFIPRFKFTDVAAPLGGGDGFKTETKPFIAGNKEAGNVGYDDTMVLVTTSAA